MSKDWPWQKRSETPKRLRDYQDTQRQRKSRTLAEKWDIELRIKDAAEDIEYKLIGAFIRVFKCEAPDIDELSQRIIEQAKTIDLSDTKPKPARKIAERIFFKTHDFDFACKYSLAKTTGLLRKAQAVLKHGNYGKAFVAILKASEEYGVFMSLQRYGLTRSIQTRIAAEKKLSLDPKQAAKKEVFGLWGGMATKSGEIS